MEAKRLYRSCTDSMLGGVAGGLAEYLEVDSIIVRLIFLLLLFSGIGFVAYILAWVLIPENPACGKSKPGSKQIEEKAEQFTQEIEKTLKGRDMKVVMGLVFLGFGIMFLSENLIGFRIWEIFWPSILIVLGVYLISKKNK